MSVKPLSCLRFLGRLFGDWWIDVILMLFILGTMVYNHVN